MLENILTAIPAHSKDIKLNLSSLVNQESGLSKDQLWGLLIASAITSKNKLLIQSIIKEAEQIISPETITAAKSAATIMGMNNIYYRFTHLVSNPDYSKMPANLRMSIMSQPGINKVNFELFSLGVSAINGCGKCMDAHEKVLIANQVDKTIIQTAIRIVAVLNATAIALETEHS